MLEIINHYLDPIYHESIILYALDFLVGTVVSRGT